MYNFAQSDIFVHRYLFTPCTIFNQHLIAICSEHYQPVYMEEGYLFENLQPLEFKIVNPHKKINAGFSIHCHFCHLFPQTKTCYPLIQNKVSP